MRDRTFYAGLVPVCAVAFGAVFANMRPTPISSTTHAEIVVTVVAPEVVVQMPTPSTTPIPPPTMTVTPANTPLPTWAGQQEGRFFLIPANTPTPIPPFVHQLCARATPVTSSDMTCLGLSFDLPGGWF